MQTIDIHEQTILDFFNRNSWLHDHYNHRYISYVEERPATEKLMTRRPVMADDYNLPETVKLLDKNGRTLRVVNNLPGFKFWKVWLWLKWLDFDETIGQAVVATRESGQEPCYILYYDPHFNNNSYTKLTLYTGVAKLQ